jgi:hypothetical protein
MGEDRKAVDPGRRTIFQILRTHLKPKLHFVHSVDPDNAGDASACPLDYFDFPGFATSVHDIYSAGLRRIRGKTVIVGGGGLLHPTMLESLERLVSNNRVVFWGVGHNVHGETSITYPDFVGSPDIVCAGFRDYLPSVPYDHVPCPSCLLEQMDMSSRRTCRIAIYEHKHVPIPVEGYPRMKNSTRSIDEIIRFLGSAEFVVTNSYHGVYWTYLIGGKPLLYEPFSSRFHGFRYPPPTCNRDTITEAMDRAEGHPGFLEECRTLNRAFYHKVLASIAGESHKR